MGMTYSSRNSINKGFVGGLTMSILSTMQAIDIAIKSVELRNDLPPKTKEEVLIKLNKVKKYDWYIKWTDEKIISTLYDYKERTGRAPTVTSLKEFGMPKSVTIYSHFHMSPSMFLKKLFPDRKYERYPNYKTEKDWLNCFIEQINKHPGIGCSSKKYNLLRDKNTPMWETIIRYLNLETWRNLLDLAGIEYIYTKTKYKTSKNIHISNCKSPIVEKLNEINSQRKKLNAELYGILNLKSE